MVMDVAISPVDANIVFASCGQLGVPDDTQAGIWKSTDAGANWTKLAGGLPATNFGRTPLAFSADGRVCAGVSNASTRQVGLYRSTNGSSTWTNAAP
jgi:hypothetical protein